MGPWIKNLNQNEIVNKTVKWWKWCFKWLILATDNTGYIHSGDEVVVGGKKIFQKTIVQTSHMEPLSKKAGMGNRVTYLRQIAERESTTQLQELGLGGGAFFGYKLCELPVGGDSVVFAQQIWRTELFWSIDAWTDGENDLSNFLVLDLRWKVSLNYLLGKWEGLCIGLELPGARELLHRWTYYRMHTTVNSCVQKISFLPKICFTPWQITKELVPYASNITNAPLLSKNIETTIPSQSYN